MKRLLTLALLAASSSAFAALPPFYQSKKEIIRLIQNPNVHRAFGSAHPIKGIVRTESGYEIRTSGGCYLEAKIKYMPREMPGPAIFEFEVAEDFSCPE